MPHPRLTVGVLIVSTTASKDPSTDASAKLLADLFAVSGSSSAEWHVERTKIVPDSQGEIQETVRGWADAEKFNLIVTTGGTGFAVSDCTPEAVRSLFDKDAPGLVHAMLSASLAITPFAMMSRPVAGVRGSSVIITLPGSPKGAKENLEAIIKLLPHACLQACDSASSRDLHSGGVKALEKEAGVHGSSNIERSSDASRPHPRSHFHSNSHQHHHHHHGYREHTVPRAHTTLESRANRPDGPITQRHRESPYPMLSVQEATDIIAQRTVPMGVIEVPVDSDLIGCVIAHDVTAAESVPAYRASIVDGYAVLHSDGKGVYPVVSVSHAAPGETQPLESGEIARITTGAPLPPGATAVVMVEDTVLKSTTEGGKEEKEVEILATDMKNSENVREVGSDVMKGDVVLRKGDVVSAIGGEIGILASVGRASVRVYRKPTVGVLSTGDELVEHSKKVELRMGEIRDSNRPTLLSAIKAWGFPVLDLGIAADQPGVLEGALRNALLKVDVIITTGGVSMGELDLLKPTIEYGLKGTIHFGRVAMKPGKPTTFATVPVPSASSPDTSTKLVFALPGNPASALVTFHLFVLPSLRLASGYSPHELPRIRVTVDHDIVLDSRPEFHRVFVYMGSDGKLHARSTGGQRSSRIGSAGGANGVLALPARIAAGKQREEVIPKGGAVEGILWGQIGGIQALL